MLEIHERLSLKELLEVIQQNLTNNIDSFYKQAKNLFSWEIIGTYKQHEVELKKEDLKKQIGNYLKVVVKNILHRISIPLSKEFPPFHELGEYIVDVVKKEMEDAINE